MWESISVSLQLSRTSISTYSIKTICNLTKHILKHHKKEQNEAIAKDDIIVKKAPKTPVKENGSSATITTTAATTNGTTSTTSTSATATATVITTPSTGLNGNHNNNNSMSAINNNLRTIKAEIEDPDYPSVMMKVTPTPVITKVVASTTTPRSRPQTKESIAMATATPVVIEEKEDEEICMLPKDMSTDFDSLRAVLISLGLDFGNSINLTTQQIEQAVAAIKKEASSSPDSVNSDNSDDYDRDSPPLPDIQPPIGGEATLALIVAATNASLQRDGGSPDSTDSQKGASPERELSPESSSSSDSCPSPPKMLQCKECGKIIRKKSHLPIHMTMSHGYPPPMVATATVVEECKPKNGTIDVELELRNIATAISELRAAQAAAPRIEDVQALSQIDCRVGKLERSLETALNSIYTLVQLQSGMTSSVNRLREDSAKHFSELKDSVNRAYSPRRMYRRSSFRSGSYSRDRSRSPM
ncbi:CRE-SYD-9 protein [Caenorhabditis remanei]|uniref:CRE-SYD-9 protein n=1 Tax=Caenorhabditis remanei TaxID=31234 RepID=E3LD30_CAERE|nr:CRE-SYD-9 protein [Caenorhabditis remanei]